MLSKIYSHLRPHIVAVSEYQAVYSVIDVRVMEPKSSEIPQQGRVDGQSLARIHVECGQCSPCRVFK